MKPQVVYSHLNRRIAKKEETWMRTSHQNQTFLLRELWLDFQFWGRTVHSMVLLYGFTAFCKPRTNTKDWTLACIHFSWRCPFNESRDSVLLPMNYKWSRNYGIFRIKKIAECLEQKHFTKISVLRVLNPLKHLKQFLFLKLCLVEVLQHSVYSLQSHATSLGMHWHCVVF